MSLRIRVVIHGSFQIGPVSDLVLDLMYLPEVGTYLRGVASCVGGRSWCPHGTSRPLQRFFFSVPTAGGPLPPAPVLRSFRLLKSRRRPFLPLCFGYGLETHVTTHCAAGNHML